MKAVRWSEEKNQALKARYGVGFDDVMIALENGRFLDERAHPNTEQYAHQRQLVVAITDYAYVVPFVESEDEVFLKTLYPSRTATARYLGKAN